MAVYKEQGEFNMFLGITINNVIRLALMRPCIYGLLFRRWHPLYFLLQNGLMLGSFQYFL